MKELWASASFRRLCDAGLGVLWVLGLMITPAAWEAVQAPCISEPARTTFIIAGPIFWPALLGATLTRIIDLLQEHRKPQPGRN